MLHYPQNFLDLFQIVKHGNDTKSRKNKILLSLFKSGTWIFKTDLCKITDMAQLETAVLELIQQSGCDNENLFNRVELNGYTFYSQHYATDVFKGVCEDGSIEFVRYINCDTRKVFKMKAGKLLRAIILETEIGQKLPDTVINYLCEQFTTKWKAYVSSLSTTKKLYVNDNFKMIYTSENLKGDFGSCMTNKNHHSFYKNAVDASAAYLIEESTGLIIARAIIFNSVYDEEGNKWRLCERQYSSESSEVYKQMLVDALYEGGYIDGHKTVGASCHEATLFVDKNGNSLSDKKFYIECNLETDEIVSYMDSFKYYSYSEGKAYNTSSHPYSYQLDITESTIDEYVNGEDDDDQYYDEYHDRDCGDVTYVHYHGNEITCDSDDLDDFTWIDRHDGYYHDDDIVFAVDTQKYELKEDCFYSELIDDYYFDHDKFKAAEKAFIEKNWFWSEIDQDYYETSPEITVINIWNAKEKKYEEKTISGATLDDGIDSGKYVEYDGIAFDNIDYKTNLPYGYKLVKIESETLSNENRHEAA